MASWDGRGLPPVAAERIARFERGPLRTSLLPVPGAAGVESVGFEPIGEVMGCIVEHIGFTGWGGCGYVGMGFGPAISRLPGGFAGPLRAGTVTSSSGHVLAGYRPYVEALYRGYRTALSRMVLEAQRIGADGVVGTRIQVTPMDGDNREFLTLGTAVRSHHRQRPRQIFTTDLPGQDFAKLLQAGWLPVHIALGISVAIRHDDWMTQRQSAWSSPNTEVLAYTELVSHVRADARHRFETHIHEAGADGGIVSDMRLRIWQIEPTEGHRDHIAESTIFGNAVSRHHTDKPAQTRSLTVLPLK